MSPLAADVRLRDVGGSNTLTFITGNDRRASVAERRYRAPAFRQRSALMQRYYFHLENGQILLDDTGVELRDIAAAQHQALRASSNIFKAGARATASLWNGTPWRMCDNPNGEGKTFFTLRFSAAM
jgi:hypothetical protein